MASKYRIQTVHSVLHEPFIVIDDSGQIPYGVWEFEPKHGREVRDGDILEEPPGILITRFIKPENAIGCAKRFKALLV